MLYRQMPSFVSPHRRCWRTLKTSGVVGQRWSEVEEVTVETGFGRTMGLG